MLELFRKEVETQVSILNQNLLILETNPESAKAIESLMRSAHAIKGAARIISLDSIVHLTHTMEDCFIAAQTQKITLKSNEIDVLLSGVDLLGHLCQVSEDKFDVWLAQNATEIEAVCAKIASFVPIDYSPRRSLVLTTSEQSGLSNNFRDRKISQETAAVPKDRVVRVSAENLNRIMGLAGESLVEATWLQPFGNSFTALKAQQQELTKILDNLHNALAYSSISPDVQKFLDMALRNAQGCREILSDRLSELDNYARRTTNLSDRLYREVIRSHMRPFADGVERFPRMVRDLARQMNKQVKLEIVGKATPVDRDILKKLEVPLTHILRNAIDHGIELPSERVAVGKSPEGIIRLEAFHRGGMLAVIVSDDGKGIDPNQIRSSIVNSNLAAPDIMAQLSEAELIEFLFLPGFSTAEQVSEISGRGVGLDIAKNMAQEVGGTLRATSHFGKGITFYFNLPLTLSVVRTLLVEISGEPYAFPLARVVQIVRVDKSDISGVEGREYFTQDGINIGLIAAHQVLELPELSDAVDTLCVVVIGDQSNIYGIVVDKFLGERDLVVRPLDPRLGKVPDISASALMDNGSPILIIDVSDLIQSTDKLLNSSHINKISLDKSKIASNRKRILVVDDSITVREMQCKLLQNHGYDVDVAVNGMDGWSAIRSNHYDLVISDIDMPSMNGIELTKQIRNNPNTHTTPVIIVSYRDHEEDRIQGLEAGADYYITKSSFQDDTLINTVANLIGVTGA
jgi:two-component system, chemotaxis family, sensor histidine kinase and response regulator WspE